MAHRCHARGCQVEVLPRMLMCREHWFMVPLALRRAVWREYKEGQEITKTPSRAYLAAMDAAVEAVAEQER